MLKQLNDPERLAAVTMRQQQARAERDDARNVADMELMLSMPGFFADYLNVLSQQGEMAARRWTHTEAGRLRAVLAPCAPR